MHSVHRSPVLFAEGICSPGAGAAQTEGLTLHGGVAGRLSLMLVPVVLGPEMP